MEGWWIGLESAHFLLSTYICEWTHSLLALRDFVFCILLLVRSLTPLGSARPDATTCARVYRIAINEIIKRQ